jgi:hypothetical protein
MKRKVWLYCINSYLVARTVGDWIQVKRMEKNLTPGHLAAKNGHCNGFGSFMERWRLRARWPAADIEQSPNSVNY